MAVTTGTSVSLVSAPQVAGQVTNLVPVVQAQDGSFVGTAGTGDPDNPTPNMVAFDASGNVRWMVPNDQPQIATSDGGVIGQSGTTYDSSGNATGQAGSLPTYSWMGDAYQQQGSAEQINADLLFVLHDISSSFWPATGGNYSDNATAYALVRTFSDNEANANVTVSGFSQTGANEQTITNVLNDILQSLQSSPDRSCTIWLNGRTQYQISAFITQLINDHAYGHGTFSNNETAAFVGDKNKDGTPTGKPASAAIAVNDSGAFFNAKLGNKTFTVGSRGFDGGTLEAQAAILIHELGHLQNANGGARGFKADAGDRQAGRDNDKLVDQYCGRLIGGLK